ncbi:MAG: antibiotic biosynthesis monooxygenase [Pseudomonadota bacterium]
MAVIAFLSRIRIHADKQTEFLKICQTLTEKVRAHEPGCLYYAFYKLPYSNVSYAVFESFIDSNAEAAHRETDYFKALIPDLLACIDGGFERTDLMPLPEH